MTNDEMKALRDFRADVHPPDEETRQRIYSYATGGTKRPAARHLRVLHLRRIRTNTPRLVAALGGAAICTAVAALAAAGAFSTGAAKPLKHAGGGGLDAPGNPLSLAFNRNAGTLSSVTVTANPGIPNANAELEVFHSAASATPGGAAGPSTIVYQEQIPLTAQQSTWSGVLSPSDWSGGCQSGRYSVVLIAVAPGTSLSDVISETPTQLSNDPNAEVASTVFSCQG
jgi:hypothetical protein